MFVIRRGDVTWPRSGKVCVYLYSEKEGRTGISEETRLDLVDIVECIVDNCSQG